jgi:hypothetical protein
LIPTTNSQNGGDILDNSKDAVNLNALNNLGVPLIDIFNNALDCSNAGLSNANVSIAAFLNPQNTDKMPKCLFGIPVHNQDF